MKHHLIILLVSISLISSKIIKFGIFSDIHLKLDYDPNSDKNFCTKSESIQGLL